MRTVDQLRRPGRSHKRTGDWRDHFKEIMTRCLKRSQSGNGHASSKGFRNREKLSIAMKFDPTIYALSRVQEKGVPGGG